MIHPCAPALSSDVACIMTRWEAGNGSRSGSVAPTAYVKINALVRGTSCVFPVPSQLSESSVHANGTNINAGFDEPRSGVFAGRHACDMHIRGVWALSLAANMSCFPSVFHPLIIQSHHPYRTSDNDAEPYAKSRRRPSPPCLSIFPPHPHD